MKLLILLALAFTVKAEAKLLNKVLANVENESITLLEAESVRGASGEAHRGEGGETRVRGRRRRVRSEGDERETREALELVAPRKVPFSFSTHVKKKKRSLPA